jgi:glycosidase
MPWTSGPAAGFTTGMPWLPIHDPAATNVASQRGDPASLLELYRRLIRLRHRSGSLRHGALTLVPGLAPGVLGYVRSDTGGRLLVLANMRPTPVTLKAHQGQGTVLVATDERSGTLDLERLRLAPHEGLVLDIGSRASIG